MQSSFLKSLATVSGFTLLSRVFGFARQVVIAGVIGAGGSPVADAFWAAFRLPNMFRRLLAEGAFQAAFIPLFQGKLTSDGEEAAKQFAEDVLSGLMLIVGVLTAIVLVAAPGVVWLVASGFSGDTEKFDLTALYLRIMFPYLACMSVVGLFSGVLNSLNRFMAYAGAPHLLNVCQIGVLLIFANSSVESAGVALAIATSVSGVLQAALLIWGASRQGYFLRLRIPKVTPELRRLLVLGGPGFISAAAVQINIVVGTNIASREPGAVSWLMNADQLYQLPLALIGIALGTVLLPTLSRRVKENDEEGAIAALNRAVELSALLVLPAAAGLVVLSTPICDALFRGFASDVLGVFGGKSSAFTKDDAIKTGAALALYGAGLPAFVWQKVFLPAYFAREDTRTPMVQALWSIAANTVLALALFPLLGFLGVALATSLAGWLQASLLGVGLLRRKSLAPDQRLLRRLPAIFAAAAAMAVVLIALASRLDVITLVLFDRDWLAVAALIVLGAITYLCALLALGGAKISDYKTSLKQET
ncbi:MAG: murein biosynthesis integral membrane protein MurJ [Pseudomonadota bacterium]